MELTVSENEIKVNTNYNVNDIEIRQPPIDIRTSLQLDEIENWLKAGDI